MSPLRFYSPRLFEGPERDGFSIPAQLRKGIGNAGEFIDNKEDAQIQQVSQKLIERCSFRLAPRRDLKPTTDVRPAGSSPNRLEQAPRLLLNLPDL